MSILPARSKKELHRALQLCNQKKDVVTGRRVYVLIVKHGLDSTSFLCDYLIRLFGSCALVQEASYVFHALSQRSVYTWHALISAYTKLGDGHSAFKFYHGMLLDGIHPDKYVFTCCLKACHLIDDIRKGKITHVHVVKAGFDFDDAIGSALIDMYATCGCIDEAFHVFDSLSSRDIVVWDTLMFGCAAQGHGILTLNLFERMAQHGIEPSRMTFICLFKACSRVGDIVYGFLLHAHLVENGLTLDLKVGNTLVDLYAKCGYVADAYAVFCALPGRDVVSWCALISGYSEYGHSYLAIDKFKCMQGEGIKPDIVTFLWVLKACGSLEFLSVGRVVHNHILQSGEILDTPIINTLIDMYSRCGGFREAQFLYDKLQSPTAVSCAAMIAGYVQHGHGLQALEIFEFLQHEGLEPTLSVFLSTLKACRSIDAVDYGREVHDEIIKRMLESDIQIGNTLIDFYAKCRCLYEACSVFQKMTSRNVVSWGAIITGCLENGSYLTALEFYEEMSKVMTSPDKVIFLAGLRACAHASTIIEGRHMHKLIVMSGLEPDIAVCSSLVDMYSRCGCIMEACHLFEKCPSRDIAMWGSMIAGFARHGSRSHVEKCLRALQHQGLEPNNELITSVLSIRNHTSALDLCRAYCEQLFNGGGNDVSVEHYSCIANILGRIGQLDEAAGLVHTMPISPNEISWTGLLTNCGTFGEHGLGYQCFDQTKDVAMDTLSFVHSPTIRVGA
ncbi:hypothetical protein L7F22_017628 [Adiantum nelumboides]|nr:hypothetical protein [Adiantum nelumboides]